MTPMANCVYDAIITDNIDIKGKIDCIKLERNFKQNQVIEDNLIEKYDKMNIEKININIDLKFNPHDYMFKFTLNIYQKDGKK